MSPTGRLKLTTISAFHFRSGIGWSVVSRSRRARWLRAKRISPRSLTRRGSRF